MRWGEEGFRERLQNRNLNRWNQKSSFFEMMASEQSLKTKKLKKLIGGYREAQGAAGQRS